MCLETEDTPSITFGNTNSDYIKPNASGSNHTAATIEGYEWMWAIDLTDVKLNGTSLMSGGGKAVFDSG